MSLQVKYQPNMADAPPPPPPKRGGDNSDEDADAKHTTSEAALSPSAVTPGRTGTSISQDDVSVGTGFGDSQSTYGQHLGGSQQSFGGILSDVDEEADKDADDYGDEDEDEAAEDEEEKGDLFGVPFALISDESLLHGAVMDLCQDVLQGKQSTKERFNAALEKLILTDDPCQLSLLHAFSYQYNLEFQQPHEPSLLLAVRNKETSSNFADLLVMLYSHKASFDEKYIDTGESARSYLINKHGAKGKEIINQVISASEGSWSIPWVEDR